MAWTLGNQNVKPPEHINEELWNLEGRLTQKEGKVTLAKFLYSNIAFTTEMVMGVKLFPFQEMILKAWFKRDQSLVIAGRGLGKSFLISVFSCLCPIFVPKSQIIIVSNNFRSSRRVFDQIIKFSEGENAKLLRQTIKNYKRNNDSYVLEFHNGSVVKALPLGSRNALRGERASHLILDELTTIDKETQDSVLYPFLMARQNIEEQSEIDKQEDELIAKGLMTEEERTPVFKNKFIGLSSASYDFDHLYKMYCDFIDKIKEGKNQRNDPSYFVMRMGYQAVPDKTIVDESIIEAAKNSAGELSEAFRREYMAIFTSSGDNYFNVKKLQECSLQAGEYPTVQLKGEMGNQYILAIDPSYSSSAASDYFAMGLYLLVPEQRRHILVNTYAVAGGNLKSHYEYLTYLLRYFNIVYLIIDASGDEFIHSYNNSSLAKQYGYNLKFLDVNLDSDDYMKEIHEAKKQYNKTAQKIVYGQKFNSNSLRSMNEYLQTSIHGKKCWFASKLQSDDTAYQEAINTSLPFHFKNDQERIDFIENLDWGIDETKNETALIEIKTSSLGSISFDLPQHMRRSTSPSRVRKDLYTCLMLATNGARQYYDIMYEVKEPVRQTIQPTFIA